MPHDGEIEYDDTLVAMLELIWGEGFLSPGGPAEVAEVVRGLDLTGLEGLDIGCGIGGPDFLLVEEHGAASLLGIDVEQPVIDRCKARAEQRGLSNRLFYRKIDPGPLPLEDESFDFVFSKDSIIHIPDKDAIFSEVFRVLRPGGWMAISDWMRRDDEEPSPEMLRYIELEGLSFGMSSPARYQEALARAGFEEISHRDRNSWYREVAREEIETLRGPLHEKMIAAVGEKAHQANLDTWIAMSLVLDSGEHRPGHLRARKPK